MHPRVVATTAVRMLVRMIVTSAGRMPLHVTVMMSVHALAPHVTMSTFVCSLALPVAVSTFVCSLALCEIVIDRFHDEYPFEPATHGWRKSLSVPFEQV